MDLPSGAPTSEMPQGVQISVGYIAVDARTGSTVTGGQGEGAIACGRIPFRQVQANNVAVGPLPDGVRPGDLLTGVWRVSITVDLSASGAPGGPFAAPAAMATPPFAGPLQAYLAGRSGSASVAVFDATDGATQTDAPQASYVTASIVKVDILATLLRLAQDAGRDLTGNEQATATRMIELSDNNAATTLWNEVGGAAGVARFNTLVGMPNTVPGSGGLWGLTRTTVSDQLRLMRVVAYPNPVLGDGQRSYIQRLMENVTPSQRWGVSGGVPAGVTVALKNGWLPVSGGWEINSIGHVVGQGRDYVIAALTGGSPTMGYGITTIQGASSLIWSTLSLSGSTSRPAVAKNSIGTMQVFVSTAVGHILTSWQTAPSQAFGGWLDMAVPATAAGVPEIGVNASGTLQVFVHTTDNRLLTSWQSAPSKGFGGWADLGGDGSIASDPSVGRNSDGTMQILVQGSGGRVLSTVQAGPNQGFVGWFDMGLPARAAGVPRIGVNASGALQAFVHTTDDRLATSWQSNASQTFGGWADLGLDGQISADPALGVNSIGTLQVFVRGTGGRMLSTWQVGPNQGFGGWLDMGLPGPAMPGAVAAVGVNERGTLQVFVHYSGDQLVTSWQGGPSQAFGGWADMGLDGRIASDPALGVNSIGTLQVFVRGFGSSVLTTWQVGPNQGFGGWLDMVIP